MKQFHCSISHADLLRILRYEPDTGNFYWRTRGRGIKCGMIAGGIVPLGYWYIGINRKRYLAHRLAWFYMYGRWPTLLIDHIDGNPSNNIFVNLREADHTENMRNAVRLGYFEDLSRLTHRNRFEAKIKVNDKHIHLGRFPTADAARLAYLSATEKYFGEFSVLKREVAR